MSDLGFDPSLKKKKKKVVSTEEAPSTEGSPAVADTDDLFSGLKKKKKAKKPVEEQSSKSSPVPADLEAEFADLTLKKKKKKSVKAADVLDFEQQLEQAGIEETTPTAEEETTTVSAQELGGLPYEELLSRFFNILKENNPELAGARSGPKFRIPPPVCQREGSKKTLFANVQEIATVLQRNPEHLIQYLFAELGTSGSIDGEKRLVLRGKFQPKQMESVLRRYIIEYVTCKTCKSMNTVLKRESANRLHFLSCNACGSTRSVSSIKTGFQAQIGKRKKLLI
ncbi:translation initiation factor eIF-2 beta subunit [Yamadazyma tenuis]|uniref:Eukaryotic translation initiation factor 2 beta subunit n=1 Tax=Candida tenuis (strain ATCC 10573 / BCRC 21748 / CBS 615 / JCM 9827 / NBRC 10315 / NRRL Y-1498 / VKM Y-70) TaxID=590646 RepID=G3AY09_CANTC|nr:eukaryotic translation initiation factor 2 beta subunit [Yamadazyma tenuis ATCC 10573]EGV65743.1 eukaryotic translation initiation factor 2 beta subunit [Yamadazyma tenuis ATCC 10573]WEJ95939.1 translation initiation factor eIF-2 beta subunit [Yamadazyma tenuis]